tara:strand:+ start:1912 stop:4728 length:2817 start_codon:yes stop_codon:yes gene_type:complete
MANQVVVSPGVYTSEKDLSFVASSVGITRLGVAGETLKGPANQPIFVQDYNSYQTYFGGQDPSVWAVGSSLIPKFEGSYIARSYLSESNNLWMTRPLGLSGYDATEALVINLGEGNMDATQATQQTNAAGGVQSDKRFSAMTACVLRVRKKQGVTFAQPNYAMQILRVGTAPGMTEVADGQWVPNGINGGSSATGVASTTNIAQPANMQNYTWATAADDFVIQTMRTGGVIRDTYVVSFNPNSNNYITKVLGTNPYYDSTNNSEARIYVEQFYPKAIAQLGKEWGGTAGNSYLDGLPHMTWYNVNSGWSNYTDTWQPISATDGPTTPWVYSEVRGLDVEKLFRLISISDGDTANKNIKVSFLNLDIDNKTFDIAIRTFDDTDAKQSVVESFKNCSMNPVSQNYIGKRIGTLNGEYSLRSRYVMVEIDDNAPIDALPSGYKGYPTTDGPNMSGVTNFQGSTFTTFEDSLHSRIQPDVYYNLNYDTVNDNVRKTYLGLSSKLGYDQNLFNYAGCATLRGTACATAWTGHTYGFHLDTRVSGSTFLGDTNLSDGKQWFSGSVGTFPFYVNSVDYVNTPYYGPGSIALAASSLNVYNQKKYRKFTVAFYGGHDGWDVSRSSRTNTDSWRENQAAGYNLGYGSGSTGPYLGAYSFNKNTDWYAYYNAIHKFANPEEVDINLFATPGIDYTNNLTLVQDTIEMIEDDRSDSLYIVTAENYKGQTVDNAVDALEDSNISSNYVATYWPWIQYNDVENNVRLYLPSTCEVLRNMAITDNVSFPWFATAGYNRGIIKANKVRINLTQDNRDDLYEARLNPIATFTATGPVIWGNKTLQTAMSALDRINVRRLLLRARKLVSAVAVRLVFEQNDEIVRQEFLSLVNPILEDIRRDRGLTDFKVVLSNDPEEIDQNKLTGKIFIKPTRSLEFIEIEFNITPTATSFDDI